MDEKKELEGPDLTKGMALADLPEGEPFAGHVDGEQVVVVKRGDDVFAVGATCTHYGGPLHHGVVVGETIRCPWHHATFSLRTGKLDRPPALEPIPCYLVERPAPGRIAVRSKRAAQTFVIVGGGAAGHVAAETLRREGYTGRIVVLSADDAPPCDRPNLSKDYLAGHAPEEWLFLRPPEFFTEKKIELVLNARVTKIDPERHEVTVEGGAVYAYDALLLATGAAPVRLDAPGADLPHVHYLRSVSDSKAIVAAAEKATSAVVIGASFIGLEVAASLRERGLAVAVVAPDEKPLGRIFGAEMGDFVQALHASHGVAFHLRRKVKSIAADHVELDDGTKLPADLVVAGIGVRPNVALAEAAGLKTDRGLLVDRFLRTSVPDIYAAGDVARWPDARTGELLRIEHWVVAERQGQVAARNMLGREEPCAIVPFFWSRHYDHTIDYVGHAEGWDDVKIDGSLDPAAPDCRVEYRRAGKLLAVATIGRNRENLQAEEQLEA